ncbi:MAG: lytic transglycosylase domain-containing protein [Burkholderiaceae bacterium]|nr:lytic transglycosylase domain-containing protein [Burkholderiaceae bacterium]
MSRPARRALVVHFAACIVGAAAAAPAGAQVYAGQSAGGAIVLSDFRSAEAPTVLIDAPRDDARAIAPAPATDIKAIVHEVAASEQVSPHLLEAVIAVESGYNPRAVSPKGAQGLMQLMPATASRFGVVDPFDPRENVRAGARYLKQLLELFGGELRLALAAYNAGEHAVIRSGHRIPPYAETQRYVPRVLARLAANTR